MDRRWILILIIIIIAVICGYHIATTSNSVGSAIIDVNKSIAVLPHDFSVGDSNRDSVALYKKDQPEKLFIKDLGKGSFGVDEIKKKNQTFTSKDDIEITDYKENITDDTQLYTIYYQNYSDTKSLNLSVSYLNTINHTFLIKCSGFRDTADIDANLNFLSETIRPDYKKSQE